jgi:hypothetical protein
LRRAEPAPEDVGRVDGPSPLDVEASFEVEAAVALPFLALEVPAFLLGRRGLRFDGSSLMASFRSFRRCFRISLNSAEGDGKTIASSASQILLLSR